MKKLGTYLLYGGALVFAIALVYISVKTDKKTESASSSASVQEKSSLKSETQETKPAEKVQVYEFHSTNRCYSCITMGQYIKAMVEKSFQPELKSGKIEFKEINVDLPENKEVAAKFQAAGTSLFINAIIDGEDNIQEEVQAWRMLGNQQTLSDYLSKKIKGMIGDGTSAQTDEAVKKENITFYSSDDCSGCAGIEKYFEKNSVRSKIGFEEKNISKDESAGEQLAEDALSCDIFLESYVVPFLWADGECYTEEKEIIDFFKQKIS